MDLPGLRRAYGRPVLRLLALRRGKIVNTASSSQFAIALFEPEIPPNTGNVIRLCANLGAELHLVEPLGFEMDDRRLRRAGLDYHEFAQVRRHANLAALLADQGHRRWLPCSTRGAQRYDTVHYSTQDLLIFGPETRGLPQAVLDAQPAAQRLRIPMRPDNRSLNLSNAVAVIAYEAWRQLDYAGGG
ncbi:MAG: tRNA (uridine(34)/cytosine(34)/5-carboxymethylaminomethyluridine(34)-2'-O)-methyltransferase TrmL [Xanthomonadales bacterium]|nr:tRNA (uridine(34)/cytosine(34)/5-carboxymethylaminomethyluridine(34)-2'-O)-methyltransferase TrmL [Xanthomonadales bacterium]